MNIILADGTTYPVMDGAALSIITVMVDGYADLETLEAALRKPGNLKTVLFSQDDVDTAAYTNMRLLEPIFTMAKKTDDGKVLATFGIREMTAEEIQIEQMEEAQEEKSEAVLMALAYLSDEEALTVKSLYPAWESLIGQTVSSGTRFLYGDNLCKVIAPDDLLIQEQYVPGQGTESIYVRIDENHAGTQEDPIPYDGNMVLEEGKYYVQDSVVYLCSRDTEVAVHQPLAELVGIYVEIVKGE